MFEVGNGNKRRRCHSYARTPLGKFRCFACSYRTLVLHDASATREAGMTPGGHLAVCL